MKRSRLYPWKTSSSFGLKYDPIMRKNEIIRAAKALHAAKVGIYSLRQSFLPDSERNAYSLIFDICSLLAICSPEAVLRFLDSIMPDTITIPSENIS